MKTQYEVQTNTVIDGWINCWHEDDDTLTVFDTRKAAQEALGEFFSELTLAGMRDSYDASDYRVTEVQ